MKYMNWGDLEKDDMIIITEKAKNYYSKYKEWIDLWCDKNLIIERIDYVDDEKIYFSTLGSIWKLYKDTGKGVNFEYDGSLFEIIGLAGEK